MERGIALRTAKAGTNSVLLPPNKIHQVREVVRLRNWLATGVTTPIDWSINLCFLTVIAALLTT
jgi:hypothetical protein